MLLVLSLRWAKTDYEIIGVVNDFHFKPVNKSISPLVIRNEPTASYCLATLETANFKSLNKVIMDIKAAASNLSPSFPVEVSFLGSGNRENVSIGTSVPSFLFPFCRMCY